MRNDGNGLLLRESMTHLLHQLYAHESHASDACTDPSSACPCRMHHCLERSLLRPFSGCCDGLCRTSPTELSGGPALRPFSGFAAQPCVTLNYFGPEPLISTAAAPPASRSL